MVLYFAVVIPLQDMIMCTGYLIVLLCMQTVSLSLEVLKIESIFSM